MPPESCHGYMLGWALLNWSQQPEQSQVVFSFNIFWHRFLKMPMPAHVFRFMCLTLQNGDHIGLEYYH